MEVRQRLSTMGAGCFCMAGAAFGGPQSHFAWQVHHSGHRSVILQGRCSTGGPPERLVEGPAAIEYYGRRLLLRGRCTWRTSVSLRGRCSTRSISVSFCVASAALGGSPAERFVEVRQRLSTMGAGCFCVAGALGGPQSHFVWPGAALGAPPKRSAQARRRLSTMGAGCFCLAGAALGGPQSHFAWQVQHLEHLGFIARGKRSTWSTSVSFCVAGATLGTPQSHFAWQAQHLEHLSLFLSGRCSTGSISVAYCGCGATPSDQHNTINTTSSTQHHLHGTINTTPSTQHHQHTTIYTTPSTQHHPHNTIYTTSSHTGRCTWSTAILPLLPHSC